MPDLGVKIDSLIRLQHTLPASTVALCGHFSEVEPTHIFRRTLSEGKRQPQARFGLTEGTLGGEMQVKSRQRCLGASLLPGCRACLTLAQKS